jgi:hypothetical protein
LPWPSYRQAASPAAICCGPAPLLPLSTPVVLPSFALPHCSSFCCAQLAGWIFSERNNRHQQLQTLLKKSEQLQSRLSDHQAVPEQRTRLDAWLASAPNPSNSLRGLFALVPADNRVLLTRVQLENITDTNESVLTMDGLAQSPTEISELNTAVLLQPQRYLLRPYGIEPAPPESSLKVKFRTECLLLPPSANNPEPQP